MLRTIFTIFKSIRTIPCFQNAIHGGSPLAAALTTSKSVAGDLDYLEKLHSLREKDVLTEDEYQEKRKQVIGLLPVAKTPS